MDKKPQVIVVGGGAAGLTAGIMAARNGAAVTILEQNEKPGRKICVTGNGRCNLTNRDMDLSHYHGTAPQFCLPALETFGVEQTLAWFRSMGLLTVTEPGGRVYPASDSANSVADVLRLTLAGRQNVTLHAGCEITELHRTKGGWPVLPAAWRAASRRRRRGGRQAGRNGPRLPPADGPRPQPDEAAALSCAAAHGADVGALTQGRALRGARRAQDGRRPNGARR